MQFVLRTLTRVQMMTRLDPQLLAEDLRRQDSKACHDVLGAMTFFEDVAEYLKQQGFDPYAHPNGKCRHCGDDILRDHNGAHYCSNACRQRAYRLRLKERRRGVKRNKIAVRDASYVWERKTTVTPAA
jgi:hypothetical protein